MKTKLLHKTLRLYVYYAIVLFVIAAPFFYFLVKKLYLDEANDTLKLHKNEFLIDVLPRFSQREIENWNKFNRNVQLTPIHTYQRDTFFTTTYFDSLEGELEPYREFNTTVVIDGKSYKYSAKLNLVENVDIIRNIFLLFLTILILLVIGIFFITKIISVSLWRPFYKALDQIEAFEIDKNVHFQETSTSIAEFERLNSSLKKLVEKNRAIYQNQKEFIENAAHELQTPLAVFKAKVDSLLQFPNLSVDHYEILDAINDNISKLSRINKNLLLLSKIENDSYQETELISIEAALNKNIEFFKEQALAKKIQIQTNYESDSVVKANAVLVDILISNLFLNAVKYNLDNGIIRISIENKKLTFENSGYPKPLRKEVLFARFSRQHLNENSTGLGLSIVKKIADLYQWKIAYSYSAGFHRFEINI